MRAKLPKCSAECVIRNVCCEKVTVETGLTIKMRHNCSKISIYLHGRMTLKQVAERLGISIARVKQIETKALARLKTVLLNKYDSFGVCE